MSKKKRIAVVFGGQSSEHEISRVSAESVIRNIDRSKFDVVIIGITKEGKWLQYDGPIEKLGSGEWQSIAESENNKSVLCQSKCKDGETLIPCKTQNSARGLFESSDSNNSKSKIDIVFPVLHGKNGEDGTIQGLFELAGIPYVGCGVLSSSLGMDKGFAKIIFEKEGLPQGKYIVTNRKTVRQDIAALILKVEQNLGYPCFVKPCNAGSSVGVSKSHDKDELIDALEFAGRYDRRIIIEEFIDGREVECAVLGNDEPVASAVGEILPCNEFYDYQAKYSGESTSKIVIPAELPEKVVSEIRDYAIRAFKALDCSGLSRIDFFVKKDSGEIYLNEVNTLPGFTNISMYPKLWEACGITYPELIEKLINFAEERFTDNTISIESK